MKNNLSSNSEKDVKFSKRTDLTYEICLSSKFWKYSYVDYHVIRKAYNHSLGQWLANSKLQFTLTEYIVIIPQCEVIKIFLKLGLRMNGSTEYVKLNKKFFDSSWNGGSIVVSFRKSLALEETRYDILGS